MFKKNRTVWGIAALVCSYLSLFISVAFIGENKRVSFKMLLMSIAQLICGLALIDEEYSVCTTVKEKSACAVGSVKEKSRAVATKVKNKIRIPVADEDEELLSEDDLSDIEEAICDELCADEE